MYVDKQQDKPSVINYLNAPNIKIYYQLAILEMSLSSYTFSENS